MSDSPIQRVLDHVSPPIVPHLRRLLDEPVRRVQDLRADLRSRLRMLTELSGHHEFIDLAEARRMAARCEALLDGLEPETPAEVRQLVQVAVRYLIEDEDAESDIDSPIGFDDDAEVVEQVARAIGREDILSIEAPEDPS